MIGKDGREIMPECNVCHLRKTPLGRSPPLEMANGLCDRDCESYHQEPLPSNYWDNEEPEL